MSCFGGLWTTWFVKSRAVDNPLSDVSVNDDPLPDLSLAEKPLIHQPSVDNDHVPSCVIPVVDKPTVETTLLDLPYHIITDILIRLPAEYVVRCQRASKLLELLTRTSLFIRTHLARQATSVIALQSFSQSSDRVFKCYFIDERAENVQKAKLKLDFCYSQKDDPIMLYDSYDGFLLFKNKCFSRESIFVIWNPTTEEQVTITTDNSKFIVCGFYFNPHNKEYEALLLHRPQNGGNSGKYAFDILSFGSKLRRYIGRYSYMPMRERPPTIINGTLFWMVDDIYSDYENVQFTCSNSIMAFEVGTNKFSTMQHGGASCHNPAHYYNKHDYMHLFEMKGQLGLCQTVDAFLSNTKLVIWVLNPATNSWTNTHTVNLPKHSRPKYFSRSPNRFKVEVVKMKDGKLLVRQEDRMLLWDLDLNTHKVLRKKGFENDSYRPVIHTHSLISLDTGKFIHLTQS